MTLYALENTARRSHIIVYNNDIACKSTITSARILRKLPIRMYDLQMAEVDDIMGYFDSIASNSITKTVKETTLVSCVS